MRHFQDHPHLKQLGNDLWQWPKSRAAVMVGSGFSLNADPLPGVKRRFPTWRELVRSMFDELHPLKPGESSQQREARFDRASPLRLASEYEAAFDRRKLDYLIRTEIPDPHYRPGSLHRMLLELPWADVFTTNYDTLLERTEVDGRTYQLVVKASELTTAFAPRIIKLHGSFPSRTPFIITDEDYRTYPRCFAPFVNSVRQSLLENSLVLVGFSGEDPNFLEWTGWIRDELSGHHAPIYLVSPLFLSNAERSLLERRGVTPIDLSPLFEDVHLPSGPHGAAMDWFLRSLATGQPPRPEKWPDSRPRLVPSRHPPIAELQPDIPMVPQLKLPLTPEIFAQLMERWQFERRSYPGWVVAQHGKRFALWKTTSQWLSYLFIFVKDGSAVDRILLFREICWRLEVSMAPLFPEWIEAFQRAVDEVFDDVISGRSPHPSFGFWKTECEWDSEIPAAWIEVAFVLLRDARESYDAANWTALKAKVDKVARQYQLYSDRNQYEQALWAVWNIDLEPAKNSLLEWQPSQSPLAQMWKAGLLAELDEIGVAKTILRDALTEIRRALRIQGQSRELLSLEGWCTYLIGAVEPISDFAIFTEVRDEFGERWEELKAWDCSPWPYMEYFDDVLVAPPPKPPKQGLVRGFDPGEVSVSFRFAPTIDPFLPGFACIRLFEQVGIPMRLPTVNIAGDPLKNACLWLAPFTGFLSPALLIRAGKLDDISRTEVAVMEPALAKRIHIWCFQILTRQVASASGHIALDSSHSALLKVCAEVLSRLTLRLENAELVTSFSLALRYRRLPVARARLPLHDACMNWFKRLFEAADDELILEWLPDLVREPLLDDGLHPALREHSWPEPLAYFPVGRLRGLAKTRSDLVSKINDAVAWLLQRAATESGLRRRWAVLRLIQIYNPAWMTADQQRQIGELLWTQRAANGLPELPGLAIPGLIGLPAVANVDVPVLIKSYILNLTARKVISRPADGGVVSSYFAGPSLMSEASDASKPLVCVGNESPDGVEWNQEEAKQLFHKVLASWANDKVAFESKTPSLTDPILRELRMLSQFLIRVVIPRIDATDRDEWQNLVTLLREVRDVGVFPTQTLPYLLLHYRGDVETVAKTITDDLYSDSAEAVGAAANALRHWIHLSAAGRVPPPPPPTPLTALIERVIFRRNPGVGRCLAELAFLITEKPEVIDASQAALLAASLLAWQFATTLTTPNGESGEFDGAERPDLQVRAAMLAGALSARNSRLAGGAREPAALTLWRDLCATSCLPEVRRAFRFAEHVKPSASDLDKNQPPVSHEVT
jgi:SIR2-like domain